jgi:uncharacterized membrane protein
MKTTITIMLTLALLSVSGCYSNSEKGGSVLEGEGFKISAPTFDVEIKQGETQNIAVFLDRGQYFKQDVRLIIKTAKGISIEPTDFTVKASDKPDVQLMTKVPKDAALGVYRVSVKGTPKTGETTSAEFNVRVAAP